MKSTSSLFFVLGLLLVGLLLALGQGMATQVEAAAAEWSQKIPGAKRFKLVLDDAAVLDKETNLVWEQSPSTSIFTWVDALSHCYVLEVGGRKGWRPPTIEELGSLVDTSNSSPALPTGHPFTLTRGQEAGRYWSATTDASHAATVAAWRVSLHVGFVDFFDKPSSVFVWCVRGGQGIDGVQ